MTINLPPPASDLVSPPNAPVAPGDVFYKTFTALTVSGAPIIAAWQPTVFPDEIITITGSAFTTGTGESAGMDTIVWVAGYVGAEYLAKQANTWNISTTVLTATIPPEFSFGMFLLWVENSAGISNPIAVNKVDAQWVGPKGNNVAASSAVRVFGRNISSNHGTTTSYVYAKLVAGSTYTPLTVTAVTPFSVQFTAPAANGTYDILVHNGHGGEYGWPAPLTLVVATQFVRDTFTIVVPPSGGNDSTPIRNALTTIGARANGGTVQLQAGTYTVTGAAYSILDKVRLLGAGKDSTFVDIKITSNVHTMFGIDGDDVAVEGIQFLLFNTAGWPDYSIFGSMSPYSRTYVRDVRIKGNTDTYEHVGDNKFCIVRGEIDGLESWKEIFLYDCTDAWVHNCTFYGDLKQTSGGAESGVTVSGDNRLVYENNHTQSIGWASSVALGTQIARRVINGHLARGALEYLFIANNTCIDTIATIVDDDFNKGELILFHITGGNINQVVSHTGNTSTVRTDGLINGTPITITPAVPIETGPYDGDVSTLQVWITGGKGIGQSRVIASNTSTTITVSIPWRVQPDSTSTFFVNRGYHHNIIYANNFAGWPNGFVAQSGWIGASNLIQLDGSCWHNVIEGSISQRTEIAGSIGGGYQSPSFWNEFRNNTTSSRQWGQVLMSSDYGIGCGNPAHGPGPGLLGNAIRDGNITVTGLVSTHNEYAKPVSLGEHSYNHWACYPIYDTTHFVGNVCESSTVNGKERGIKTGSYSDTIYRNNNITVTEGVEDYNIVNPNEHVLIREACAPSLLGNTYSSEAGSIRYANLSGAKTTTLTLPTRVLCLSGASGQLITGNIPVYNSNIATAVWSATSQTSWISVETVDTTLVAEANTGNIIVDADTTGLPTGRSTGVVRVVMGAEAFLVTVRVDVVVLLPPPPSNGGTTSTVYDADILAEILDYRTGNIADLPQIGPNKFSLPITAKAWPDYYRGWGVWFNPAQDPADDVSVAVMMSNRGHMANLAQSSGNFRDVVWRTAYWSSKRYPITSIKLVYSNSYLDATGEHNGLNTIFVTASVEYNNVSTPVPFFGQREVTIAPGAVVVSDQPAISIPINTMFWVRQNVRTANATEKYPTGYVSVAALGEGYSTTTPLAQVDATGTLTGVLQSNMFGPTAVLGTSIETSPPHIAIIGSSSAFGTGENFSALPNPGDRGYLQRLVSNNFGQTALATSSNSLSQWLSASSLRMAILAAIRPSHVVLQLGANDILNGASASTVQSNLQTVWNQLSAAGYRVIQTTHSPSSTGTFTTLGGQTPTFTAARAQVNAFIRGVPAPLVGVLDVGSITESSPGSGLWRIDGGAWTTDGIHTTRHADVAAALSLSVFG